MISWRKISRKALHWGEPMLVEESCVHHHSRKGSCSLCKDICPLNGIVFGEDGLPQLKNCNSCGRCVAICPNKAWKLDEDRIPWQKKRLILECVEDNTRLGLGVGVHCMWQFLAEDIGFWLQHFEEVVILIDKQACTTCAYGWSYELLESIWKNWPIANKDRLSMIDTKEKRTAFLQDEETKHAYNRREAGIEVREQGLNYAEKTLAVYLEEKSPTNLYTSREKLAHSLLKNTSTDFIFHQHRKLEACRCQFCGACVQLRPTDALRLYEDEDRTRALAEDHLRCTACSLCVDICPVKGLCFDEGLHLRDFTEPDEAIMIYSKGHTCADCGMDFWEAPTQNEHCPYCRIKK